MLYLNTLATSTPRSQKIINLFSYFKKPVCYTISIQNQRQYFGWDASNFT